MFNKEENKSEDESKTKEENEEEKEDSTSLKEEKKDSTSSSEDRSSKDFNQIYCRWRGRVCDFNFEKSAIISSV